MRLALLVVLALLVAACGQVGVSGSPSNLSSASPAGVAGLGGSSPSTATDTPVISGTPATSAIVGQAYSFTPTASDPQGNALTFSITNLPSWASFDSTSGTLSGTPTADSVGTYGNVLISVSNGQATASLPAFAITVEALLTISGTPATTAVVGSPYDFVPTTNAPPGTTLTFAVQNAPSWATFDATTGELSGTPTQAGTFPNIMISVSDGIQSAALAAFTITVSSQGSTGSPPTIGGHPATGVVAGSPYSFTPSATSPSGAPLTFSVQNPPPWANFSTANGSLTGTPTTAQVGTYTNIVISVTDGTLSASLAPFSIKVVAPLSISGA
ncbi:MAG TPA: putative Ig domain-containing protein, partial [Steroidobacteraceae bacterium]|nr:putative Ig domain-containing protein [Steroidobacteraceae bacterium]